MEKIRSDSTDDPSDSVTATGSFRDTISDIVRDPADGFDVGKLLDKGRRYVERVIGPRRPGEHLDAYGVRVFVELLEQCDPDEDRGRSGGDPDAAVSYAREAAERGDPATAKEWYLRSIVDAGGGDPTLWVLYGAFCVRQRDVAAGLACARRALAADGLNRLALFAHAAMSMIAWTERFDELERSFKSLETEYPRFGEAHMLAALHYRRMDMPDRTGQCVDAAKRWTDQPWTESVLHTLKLGPGTVWDPVDHGSDPAVKCAMLLIGLELPELAEACLRYFADDRDSYHYLMAVSHHKRGRFQASADHLNSMTGGMRTGVRCSLLAAHNDHGAGRTREAVAAYVELAMSGPVRPRFGLAYSRIADHHAADGRHAEAAAAYSRACTVTGSPALMTKLAGCLIALNEWPEAEKLLTEAVAMDGPVDGIAWRYLSEVHANAGRNDLAEVCGRRASELLGSEFEPESPVHGVPTAAERIPA